MGACFLLKQIDIIQHEYLGRVKLQRLCSVFVADLVYPLILCQSYANPTYLKPHGKRLNRHRHIQAVPTKDMKII